MSNRINLKISGMVSMVAFLIVLSTSGYINSVHAQELNTLDFKYSVHITDIIPYYTYQGISKVLSNGELSFEDQDTIRLIIEDTDFYAVYNNANDNTFQFAGIYQGSGVGQ